jgi:hypothetical protein
MKITAIIMCMVLASVPGIADAKFLVHATKGRFVPGIMKKGLKTSKMNPKARIGGQKYFGNDLKTAMKEKPGANAAILFKKSRTFNKRILDTTHMSKTRLKSVSGLKDMRGAVKKGVLGPKIGQRIGRYANRNTLIVKYKSARYRKGVNYAIPPNLYKRRPRIVSPVKSTELR